MPFEAAPGAILAQRLGKRTLLSADDVHALTAMRSVERELTSGSYIVREGQRPAKCQIILSGTAVRHKLTDEGSRQIVCVMVATDLADCQNLFLPESDHNVQALTRTRVAEFEIVQLRDLVLTRPAIARAMWIEALTEASIYREWLINVGRRDAKRRIGHLLCELVERMKFAGVSREDSFELPMTQEQLGDATGLTPVHVNRTLKALGQDGLLDRNRRTISVADWTRLRAMSDFDPRYLHQDILQAPGSGSLPYEPTLNVGR